MSCYIDTCSEIAIKSSRSRISFWRQGEAYRLYALRHTDYLESDVFDRYIVLSLQVVVFSYELNVFKTLSKKLPVSINRFYAGMTKVV